MLLHGSSKHMVTPPNVSGKAWEDTFSENNIRSCFRQHIYSKGGQGVDRISVDLFKRDLQEHIPIIARKCKEGTYKFSPYLEVLQSKGRDKNPRVISIPTVRDRLVLKLLTEYLHLSFDECIARDLPNTVIRKIKKGIGARFNTYRRLQRKQNASIFSISILSVYLIAEAVIPEGTLPPEAEKWRKAFVVLASIFILILSLLEARKSYELKAERLHNNAMELNALYDAFKISTNEDAKKKKIEDYHTLIASCPENHEPHDDALFRASHRKDYKIPYCQAKWIQATYFIQTYWLYATLVILPPFIIAVLY
ncbi:MAG: SLATT domain-containing protein [Alphaproteobacteria bacterium]|nr:SLATT domain-containing protein [Alphaproteobacteria bacterium]